MTESASSAARKRSRSSTSKARTEEIKDLKEQRVQLRKLLKAETDGSKASTLSRELRQINERLTRIDTDRLRAAAEAKEETAAAKKKAAEDKGVKDGTVAKFEGRRGAGSSRKKTVGRRPGKRTGAKK